MVTWYEDRQKWQGRHLLVDSKRQGYLLAHDKAVNGHYVMPQQQQNVHWMVGNLIYFLQILCISGSL